MANDQSSSPTAGTVKRLIADRGFGFINTEAGQSVFFHRTSVRPEEDFDRVVEGTRVQLTFAPTVKGLRALEVRLV